MLEERLGRDAAPVEACAAKSRRAFDDCGLQPELRGPDGRDVAARTGPDYNHIVFTGHDLTGYCAFFLMEDKGTKDIDGTSVGAAGGSASACACPGSRRATWDRSRV